MKSSIQITTDWLGGERGAAPVRETVGRLRLSIGPQTATRNEDLRSQTVKAEVCASAYPLALWLVQNFWRLRWEGVREGVVSSDWRMAHELPAAGHGYVWPNLTFVSDGEGIEVRSRASFPSAVEPIRYLDTFVEHIDAESFEKGVSDFVALVLERLDAVNVRATDLHALWNLTQDERREPETSLERRIEALSGFDPDEAPSDLIDRLCRLSTEAGRDATGEIASLCATSNPLEKLSSVVHLANQTGEIGKPVLRFRKAVRLSGDTSQPPAVRGRTIASHVRKERRLDTRPLSDGELAELLSASSTLFVVDHPARKFPATLAVRRKNEVIYHLRHSHPTSRRFEASRLLGDQLTAPQEDRWHVAADTKTARQKLQRAFAAELLCPLQGLQDYLNGDFSDEALETAGRHFRVSPLVVRSNLAFAGLIPLFDTAELHYTYR